MRRAARVDGNHAEIVAALRSFPGVSVCSLASLGNGVPDLIVGLAGQNYLVEVKDGEKSQSRQSLTPDQERFFLRWKGKPPVVLTSAGKALSWARQIARPYSVEAYLDAWGSGVA